MKRRLFHVMTVLSLLIWLSCALLWVRGYWVNDWLVWKDYDPATAMVYLSHPDRVFEISLERGSIGIYCGPGDDAVDSDDGPVPRSSIRHFHYFRAEPRPLTANRWYGNAWYRSDMKSPSLRLLLPYWMPMLLASIAPSIFAWRIYHRACLKPELCRVCGYDLRATPEKCSECGTITGGTPVVR